LNAMAACSCWGWGRLKGRTAHRASRFRANRSPVLFFGRHVPLVLGNELAVSVVVEAGKGHL